MRCIDWIISKLLGERHTCADCKFLRKCVDHENTCEHPTRIISKKDYVYGITLEYRKPCGHYNKYGLCKKFENRKLFEK